MLKKGKFNLFLILYIPVFLALGIIAWVFPREEIHMWMNGFHTGFWDVLMKGWTYLGDGVVVLIFCLLFLLVSFRYTIGLLAAFAMGGLGAQFFKRVIFTNSARPVKYFEIHGIDYDLYLVPGAEPHAWHSFPSGHTATAFAVFFALSLFLKSRWLQVASMVIATGVAISRIYLSQHFLMDVVAGSVVGVVFGWVAWRWLDRYEASWLDLSLVKLLRR